MRDKEERKKESAGERIEQLRKRGKVEYRKKEV